jgi:hypothetical protein
VLLDNINRKALDAAGDAILEFADEIFIYDDYIERLRKAMKSEYFDSAETNSKRHNKRPEGGVVPRIGLEYIAVGRDAEIGACSTTSR